MPRYRRIPSILLFLGLLAHIEHASATLLRAQQASSSKAESRGFSRLGFHWADDDDEAPEESPHNTTYNIRDIDARIRSMWPMLETKFMFLAQLDSQPSAPLDIVVDQRTNDEIRIRLLVLALQAAISLAVWTVLMCCVAYFYHKHSEQPPFIEDMHTEVELLTLTTWKYPLFNCFEEQEISFWACCCPAIRWADTISLAGYLGFWGAFCVYMLLNFLNALSTYAIFYVLLCVVCTYYRQRLRKTFNFEYQGGCSICTDCLLYAFCTCCIIVQEARQVEAAYRCGHPEMQKLRKDQEMMAPGDDANYETARYDAGDDPFLVHDLSGSGNREQGGPL